MSYPLNSTPPLLQRRGGILPPMADIAALPATSPQPESSASPSPRASPPLLLAPLAQRDPPAPDADFAPAAPQAAAPHGPPEPREPRHMRSTVQTLVARVLTAHPRNRGYRPVDLLPAIRAERPQSSLKQVIAACHQLVRYQPGFMAISAEGQHPRYRRVRAEEKPDFVCARKDWPLLLALAGGECRNYAQMRRTSHRTEQQVAAFIASLRVAGALLPGPGMPQIDLAHPAVQRELWAIRAVASSRADGAPVAADPPAALPGSEVCLRFLASQSACQWFTASDLAARFPTLGGRAAVSGQLEHCVRKRRVQVAFENGAYHYRLDPDYRARVQQAVADTPWQRLLPVSGQRSPAAGQTGATHAAATGTETETETMAPARLHGLPGMDGYQVSRGLDRTAAGKRDHALEFLALQHRAAQWRMAWPPHATVPALLQALDRPPLVRHAVLCLSNLPTYVEAWRGESGIWWAQPLVGGPDRPAPEPLERVAAQFFEAGAGESRGIEVIQLNGRSADASPRHWF